MLSSTFPWRLVLAALAAVLALTGTLAAAAPARADAPAVDQATARFEVNFMTGMAHHHHMAVMMSEMCLEKAVHPELEAMCADIITAQLSEITQLHMWLMDWYGVHHEPEMDPGGMGSMQRYTRLHGAEFETAFMQAMVRHHWGAVRESQRCLDRAAHDELRSMCEQIIETQLEEIAQMQEWLEDWYDRRGGRPVH